MNGSPTISARTLSQVLCDLQDSFSGHDTVSIKDIIQAFQARGFGFFIFLFALPAALPLPAIGIGTILALPLLFLTAQHAFGRKTLWLPAWLEKKELSQNKLDGFVTGALPWMKQLEYIIRPRLRVITEGFFARLFSIFGFIMAISVLFPLPLTNTVPALGVALIGIGMMMRDGLAIIAGTIIGMAWITLLIWAILFFGPEGFEIIKDFIKELLL